MINYSFTQSRTVTYMLQRAVHVHPPHLVLQVVEHLVGVGTVSAGWGHAVSRGLGRGQGHGLQGDALP